MVEYQQVYQTPLQVTFLYWYKTLLTHKMCFSHLFLCSLPFLRRCRGCVWWIEQYLSLGGSKELFGKICTRSGYRPQKDTGMGISSAWTSLWLPSWENNVRNEFIIYPFAKSLYKIHLMVTFKVNWDMLLLVFILFMTLLLTLEFCFWNRYEEWKYHIFILLYLLVFGLETMSLLIHFKIGYVFFMFYVD